MIFCYVPSNFILILFTGDLVQYVLTKRRSDLNELLPSTAVNIKLIDNDFVCQRRLDQVHFHLVNLMFVFNDVKSAQVKITVQNDGFVILNTTNRRLKIILHDMSFPQSVIQAFLYDNTNASIEYSHELSQLKDHI